MLLRVVEAAPALRVATHLAPSVQPLYSFLAEHLAERLGRAVEFTVADSYERCASNVDDVCFVCSIPYLLLSQAGRTDMRAIAAPVLAGDRYGGRPVYFSDVVVRADSRFEAFADLRGAVLAYNEPYSHSGYLVVLHHLWAIGEPIKFFGQLVEAGYHSRALRLVADGSVDAAAIDSQVLAIELRDNPELARQVRIIDTLGPSTIQPLVVSQRRLTADERRSLVAALVSVRNHPGARPFLDAALVDRFVPVDDNSYADVRLMLARVRRAGLVGSAWLDQWRTLTRAAEPAGR